MATSPPLRMRDRICSRTAPSSLHPDMRVMHAVHVDCARAFSLPRFTCTSHHATPQQSHCVIPCGWQHSGTGKPCSARRGSGIIGVPLPP